MAGLWCIEVHNASLCATWLLQLQTTSDLQVVAFRSLHVCKQGALFLVAGTQTKKQSLSSAVVFWFA